MTNPTPLHESQITRTLPKWSKVLQPAHTHKVLQSLRKEYLDEDGSPYSWYATADEPAREQLLRAIKTRDKRLVQVRQALAGFQDIVGFCTPLLTKRLKVSVPVDRAQYVFQPFESDANIWVGVPDVETPLVPDLEVDVLNTRPVGEPQTRSLLEAALHNFEGLAEVGAGSPALLAAIRLYRAWRWRTSSTIVGDWTWAHAIRSICWQPMRVPIALKSSACQ